MKLKQVIKEIVDEYRFSEKEDINPLLESILRYTMMEYLGKDVDVFINGNGIDAYLYRDGLSGTYPERVDFSRLGEGFYRRLYKNLKYYFELKKKTLQFEIVRGLQGKLVGGYIIEKLDDRYRVRLTEQPFEDLEVVLERDYWIPKEVLLVGEHYFFLCKNIRVVADLLPRLVMYLSRTSIRLPALLLEKAFYEDVGAKTKCVCLKRVVGKFSFVKCKTKMAGKHIKWVSRNLNNEKIIVSRF